MSIRFEGGALSILLLAAATAQAEPFTYQGELRVSGGNDSEVDLQLRIYDAASGGLPSEMAARR